MRRPSLKPLRRRESRSLIAFIRQARRGREPLSSFILRPQKTLELARQRPHLGPGHELRARLAARKSGMQAQITLKIRVRQFNRAATWCRHGDVTHVGFKDFQGCRQIQGHGPGAVQATGSCGYQWPCQGQGRQHRNQSAHHFVLFKLSYYEHNGLLMHVCQLFVLDNIVL